MKTFWFFPDSSPAHHRQPPSIPFEIHDDTEVRIICGHVYVIGPQQPLAEVTVGGLVVEPPDSAPAKIIGQDLDLGEAHRLMREANLWHPSNPGRGRGRKAH